MVVEKILTPPTVQGQIDKINEIIDYLGDSGNTSYVATCPALTPLEGVVTWTVTHNLGTSNVSAFVYSSAGLEIMKDVSIVSDNAVTISFDSADTISAGAYKVVVFASGGSGGSGGGGSADDTYTNSTTNVEIVGSLTNNQGVLSDFSPSNYAKFPNNFQPSNNSWEMTFKVTTGTIEDSWQHILAFQKGLTNAERYATRVSITPNNKFGITLCYDGTTWDVAGEFAGQGTHTVLANTTYYLKFEFTGTVYKLSYSFNGETYTQDCYVESSTPIYNSNTAYLIGIWNNGIFKEPFLGSINLKESYININGSRWWTGAENIELTNLSPVTDYYVSGSSWYKETFSDATRTKRIWLEQGGKTATRSTDGYFDITFAKPFSNTQYTVTTANIFAGNAGESEGVTNITNTGFRIYMWNGRAKFWRACGV